MHCLEWVEPELLFIGYKYLNEYGEDEATAYLYEQKKFIPLGEIVPVMPSDELSHQYYVSYLSEWRMFFIGCSMSSDIELLVDDTDDEKWKIWKPNERYQARLPMTADDDDTFPIGLCLSLNSQKNIPGDDVEEQFLPAPLVLCLTTGGLLLNFAFVDQSVDEAIEFITEPQSMDELFQFQHVQQERDPVMSNGTSITEEKVQAAAETKTTSNFAIKPVDSGLEYGKNDENQFASDDDESDDDEEEIMLETEKASTAFDSVDTTKSGFILAEDFEKLFPELGTVYCETEHRKTINKLQSDGQISRADFIAWYIKWLFEGDDSSEEEDDRENLNSDDENDESSSIFDKFMPKEGTWKCEQCMVSNEKDAEACISCESPNPDMKKKTSDLKATDAPGSVGANGFTFPSSSTASTPSFSFGISASNTTPATPFSGFTPTGSTEGLSFGKSPNSGFSFGVSATASNDSAPVASSGFQFSTSTEQVGKNDEVNAQNPSNFAIKPVDSGLEYGKNDENQFASDDDESDDDEEEIMLETEKASTAFDSVDTTKSGFILAEDFEKLFPELGTVYCETEHRKTINKLQSDGQISRADFIAWYIKWLFEGDDSSEEEDDRENLNSDDENDESSSIFDKFMPKEGTWKCEQCMVSNEKDAEACISCESPNPDMKKKTSDLKATDAPGSVGANGFTFPSSSTASTPSFSFGISASNTTPATPFSGFTPTGSTEGLSFGKSPNSGFSFGVSATASNDSAPVASSGFQFSTSTKPVDENTSSSAYPPDMSGKKPPPAFGAPVAAKPAAKSSSAYPPDMSSKKPPPAFGAPVFNQLAGTSTTTGFCSTMSESSNLFGGKSAMSPFNQKVLPSSSKPNVVGSKVKTENSRLKYMMVLTIYFLKSRMLLPTK